MSRTPLANESTEMHRLLRGAVAGCLADVVRWVPRGEAQPPSAPLAAAPQRRERPSTATPSREPVPPPLVAPLAVALGTDRLRAAFDLWLRYDGSDRLTQCWWMSCPDGISGPTAHVTSILLRAAPGAVHELDIPWHWDGTPNWSLEDIEAVIRVALATQAGVLRAISVPDLTLVLSDELVADILDQAGTKGLQRLYVRTFGRDAMPVPDPSIQYPYVPQPQVIEALARCTALEALDWSLPFRCWTGAAASLKATLRELTVPGALGIDIVNALPNLRSLTLYGGGFYSQQTMVRPWCTAMLAVLPQLERLDLRVVFGPELAALAAALELTRDASASPLPLRRLGLELFAFEEMSRQIAVLARHAPLLNVLAIDGVTPEVLKSVVNFTRCRSLRIWSSAVDDAAVAAILAGMPQLRCLDITGCRNVTLEAAAYERAGVYGRHKLRQLAGVKATTNADDLALAILPSLRRIAMAAPL